MQTFKLQAEPRTDLGKKAAKNLRAAGMIPAVLNSNEVVSPRKRHNPPHGLP